MNDQMIYDKVVNLEKEVIFLQERMNESSSREKLLDEREKRLNEREQEIDKKYKRLLKSMEGFSVELLKVFSCGSVHNDVDFDKEFSYKIAGRNLQNQRDLHKEYSQESCSVGFTKASSQNYQVLTSSLSASDKCVLQANVPSFLQRRKNEDFDAFKGYKLEKQIADKISAADSWSYKDNLNFVQSNKDDFKLIPADSGYSKFYGMDCNCGVHKYVLITPIFEKFDTTQINTGGWYAFFDMPEEPPDDKVYEVIKPAIFIEEGGILRLCEKGSLK